MEILGIFTILLVLQIFFSLFDSLCSKLMANPLYSTRSFSFWLLSDCFTRITCFSIRPKKLLHLSIVILCYLSISFYLYGLHGLTYFKYPPQLSFILYGCFLWYMLAKYERNFFAPISNHLSLHSQELYFIHIFYIYEFYLSEEGSLLNNWFFHFIYLLSISLLTLFLINQGKKKVKQIKNKTRQVECDE